MKFFAATVIALLAAVSAVSGQIIKKGECPTDTPVVQNFDVDKYGGLWYEIDKYFLFRFNYECVSHSIVKNAAGDGLDASINFTPIGKSDQTSFKGKAAIAFPDAHIGKLNLTFTAEGTVKSNYWVLATDYENAAVVWHCDNIAPGQSAQSAWIISRQPTLNEAGEKVIKDVVEKYLDKELLVKTKQGDDCKYIK